MRCSGSNFNSRCLLPAQLAPQNGHGAGRGIRTPLCEFLGRSGRTTVTIPIGTLRFLVTWQFERGTRHGVCGCLHCDSRIPWGKGSVVGHERKTQGVARGGEPLPCAFTQCTHLSTRATIRNPVLLLAACSWPRGACSLSRGRPGQSR